MPALQLTSRESVLEKKPKNLGSSLAGGVRRAEPQSRQSGVES